MRHAGLNATVSQLCSESAREILGRVDAQHACTSYIVQERLHSHSISVLALLGIGDSRWRDKDGTTTKYADAKTTDDGRTTDERRTTNDVGTTNERRTNDERRTDERSASLDFGFWILDFGFFIWIWISGLWLWFCVLFLVVGISVFGFFIFRFFRFWHFCNFGFLRISGLRIRRLWILGNFRTFDRTFKLSKCGILEFGIWNFGVLCFGVLVFWQLPNFGNLGNLNL